MITPLFIVSENIITIIAVNETIRAVTINNNHSFLMIDYYHYVIPRFQFKSTALIRMILSSNHNRIV